MIPPAPSLTDKPGATADAAALDVSPEGILDALPAHTALLDRNGLILRVNKAWRRFGETNGIAPAYSPVGQNYLAICAGASGEGAHFSPAAAIGIGRVLRGEATGFELEYPCHSPNEQRWFQLLASPLDQGQGGAVIMHVNITQRRYAEGALQASRSRLRAVFEAEPECVKIESLGGTLLDLNAAGLRVVQARTLAEVAGRAVTDMIHPDDHAAYMKLHAQVAAGATGQLQYRVLGLHGSERWMEGHSVPLRGADGTVDSVLSVSRDITEQKASLERLQQSRALLRIASRMGRIGAWVIELPSNAVTWSDEVCAIHEVPKGFAPSMEEGISYYAPEYRDTVRRSVQACISAGIPFDHELEILTATGRRAWVRVLGEAERDAQGLIHRVQGAFQDISDRKEVEERTRMLAHSLASTLETITDAFLTIDREWRLTFINTEAERVLRRSRAEVLGTNIWDAFPEARGSRFQQEYERALETGRPVEFEEFYEPLGVWFELRAFPSAQGLAVYFRDVTERRQARDEIARLYAEMEQRVLDRTAQLEEANKELEAFSYSVAHDLRAPLSSINGFSQLLGSMLAQGTDGKAAHYLQRIRAGVDRMDEMTRALLALAQLSRASLQWEDVDLGAMARVVLARLAEGEPQRTVKTFVQDDLRVRGDPRLLMMLMENLIGNAWKFSARTEQAEITVGCETGPAGQALFFVRDNGVGFDMAHTNKLFVAFERLHHADEYDGTGIGLANVHRIVSRHGGRVWADAAPGRGATFYFTLGREPAAPAQ
jgi:PAS domain S-box-containing protein